MKSQQREITVDDYYNLPDFLRIEIIDGKICTDNWTILEIDEEVFQNPPSEKRHVKYRLSVIEVEEKEQNSFG